MIVMRPPSAFLLYFPFSNISRECITPHSDMQERQRRWKIVQSEAGFLYERSFKFRSFSTLNYHCRDVIVRNLQ